MAKADDEESAPMAGEWKNPIYDNQVWEPRDQPRLFWWSELFALLKWLAEQFQPRRPIGSLGYAAQSPIRVPILPTVLVVAVLLLAAAVWRSL